MVKTILIVRKDTRCRHIGYSYRLTARVLLYAPSHRQDNTYHGLCYTSLGALAGTRNSSMGTMIVLMMTLWKTSPLGKCERQTEDHTVYVIMLKEMLAVTETDDEIRCRCRRALDPPPPTPHPPTPIERVTI